MNNILRKKAFTMLELVFTIVIIGILSAVALPRFTETSDTAHTSKLLSFVATLNRTVAPIMWSGIQRNDYLAQGSVNTTTFNMSQYGTLNTEASDGANAELTSIPIEFENESLTGLITLTNRCANSLTIVPAINTPTPIVGVIARSIILGSNRYDLGCIDSDLNHAPKFWLGETGGNIIQN